MPWPLASLLSSPPISLASTNQLQFDSGNWNIPQSVTITGQEDEVGDGDVAYQLNLGAATTDGHPNDDIYVGLTQSYVGRNDDNDTPGVTIDTSLTGKTTELGGATSFTVSLDTEPSGTVVIYFGVTDTTEALVTGNATMVITPGNWMFPQTVTITGQDDNLDDANASYKITYNVTGAGEYMGIGIPLLDALRFINSGGLFEFLNVYAPEYLQEGATGDVDTSSGAINPLLFIVMGLIYLNRRRRM